MTRIAEAAALLDALAHRGIVLSADAGGSIRYRCRPGRLTVVDRAAVDMHRPELVALLHARARPIYQPGDRPPGLLRLVPHEHHCAACGQALRCTAPSCAGRSIRCVCCVLDRRPATKGAA
jgi:hypothetical protein